MCISIANQLLVLHQCRMAFVWPEGCIVQDKMGIMIIQVFHSHYDSLKSKKNNIIILNAVLLLPEFCTIIETALLYLFIFLMKRQGNLWIFHCYVQKCVAYVHKSLSLYNPSYVLYSLKLLIHQWSTAMHVHIQIKKKDKITWLKCFQVLLRDGEWKEDNART